VEYLGFHNRCFLYNTSIFRRLFSEFNLAKKFKSFKAFEDCIHDKKLENFVNYDIFCYSLSTKHNADLIFLFHCICYRRGSIILRLTEEKML